MFSSPSFDAATWGESTGIAFEAGSKYQSRHRICSIWAKYSCDKAFGQASETQNHLDTNRNRKSIKNSHCKNETGFRGVTFFIVIIVAAVFLACLKDLHCCLLGAHIFVCGVLFFVPSPLRLLGGSCGALGQWWSPVTPCLFAWQACHLVTCTLTLRGGRGVWSHALCRMWLSWGRRGKRGRRGSGLALVARFVACDSAFLFGGRNGIWCHACSLCVGGAALGAIMFLYVPFVWQTSHLRHRAGYLLRVYLLVDCFANILTHFALLKR